jgi:hypothetical protein
MPAYWREHAIAYMGVENRVQAEQIREAREKAARRGRK